MNANLYFLLLHFYESVLDVFIVNQLAQLPAAKNVVVTASNPGLCFSEFLREMPEDMVK